MSLSSHQSRRAQRIEYLTPPSLLEPLGSFDLDPCAPPPSRRAYATAVRHIALPEDGLRACWTGRVWLNPPFGNEAALWLRKMAEHGNGIALIPARTETRMFLESVWGAASAVCFLRKRPHFYLGVDTWVPYKRAPGGQLFVKAGTALPFNSGVPMCLVAYNSYNATVLDTARLGTTVQW